MLSSELVDNTCLTDYGYVSFSYSCEQIDINCDFEVGFCNWKSENMGYAWKRKRGPTATQNTGPSTDHTLGSNIGYYVYLEANGVQEGKVAFLVSSPLKSGEWCLTFWYHMYGSGMGDLTVYLYEVRSTFFSKLHTLSGNKGNKWLEARINISISETKPQYIVFKGARGSTQYSDIAIDDIVVVGGRCTDSKNYKKTCSNVGEPVSLARCSKEDLKINKNSIIFEPNFQHCLDVYGGLQESIHNLCSDGVAEFCRLDLSNPTHADLDCFLLNRIKVEYICKDVNVTENMQQMSDIGAIVGIVVGVGVIAALIVVVVCILRRYRLKSASKGQQGLALHRISLQSSNINVYNGLQNRNVPSNSNHLNYDRKINSINANTAGHNPSLNNTLDHQYDYMDLDSRKTGLNRKAATNAKNKPDQSPGYKNMSKDNQYAVNDPKNTKGTKRHKKLDTTPIDNYAILDPNETGFSRSTGNIETKTQYELAISINPEMNESDLQDPYVVTGNGTYDSSSNIRHKEADTNVYSHTVDSVYDKTSHDANRPKMDDNDNTYNHVFGKKTEDDYDVTFNKERE